MPILQSKRYIPSLEDIKAKHKEFMTRYDLMILSLDEGSDVDPYWFSIRVPLNVRRQCVEDAMRRMKAKEPRDTCVLEDRRLHFYRR